MLLQLSSWGTVGYEVKILDLGDKASQIQIDMIITNNDAVILPWTSAEETYGDVILWTLAALITYPIALGLSSSLW